MHWTVDAIYEGGVFKPLEPVAVAEKQRVRLTVESPEEAAQRELAAWEQVYAGLSEDEILQVERLVKDKTCFMRPHG